MAVKHRKQRQRVKRAATLSVATATVTALTVGVAPPQASAAAVQRDVDLQSGWSLFPPPQDIPDLTGGFGTSVYNWSQDLGAQLTTAVVENLNLIALLKAFGLDPATVLRNAINDQLGNVIEGADLAHLTVDIAPILEKVGDALGIGGLVGLLADIVPTKLAVGPLLVSLGLDLDDPLSTLGKLGITPITAGGPFTALRLLGLDLGWTPSFPNSVADEINNAPYLEVNLFKILGALGLPTDPIGLNGIRDLLNIALLPFHITIPKITDVDAVDVRIPIVAGWSLGAFSAGAAYQQVVDQLPNQPGGANYSGTNPLLGSFTILPMLLIDNPGRANGGLFARAYPLLKLLGIDPITPETQIQSSSDGSSPLNDVHVLGLTLGGANLVPIKIDATAQYLPLSDFAAWANPFTIANNVAAGMFLTYMLRDQSLDSLGDVLVNQVLTQVGDAISGYIEDPTNPTKGPALNVYVTLPARSLPLLEPTYLAIDALNLVTGLHFNNPIATALSPVLTSLVNLGYTDVYYDAATGIYQRTLTEAGTPTAFGTLPKDIDWSKVPGNLLNAFFKGVQKAFSDGLINKNPVASPIESLLHLLGVGGTSTTNPAINTNDLLSDIAEKALNEAGVPSINSADFEPQGVTDTGVAKEQVNAKVLKLNTEALKSPVEVVKDLVDDIKAPLDGLKETVDPAKDSQEGTEPAATDGANTDADQNADKDSDGKDSDNKDAAGKDADAVKGGKGTRSHVRQHQRRLAAAAEHARDEVEKTVDGAGERVKAAADRANQRTARAVRHAQEQVNRVADEGRKQIREAAGGGDQTAAKDHVRKGKKDRKDKAGAGDNSAKSDAA